MSKLSRFSPIWRAGVEGGRLRARGGDGPNYCIFTQYLKVPIMTLLDRPPPTPMPAARIRELYARNPTAETCALA